MPRTIAIAAFSLCLAVTAFADGPADNIPDKVRRIPPLGIKDPDADRAALTQRVAAIEGELQAFRSAPATDAKLAAYWPDVQVYLNAVKYALEFDQFYKDAEVAAARDLLDRAADRLKELKAGKAPWDNATGLIVRGYASKIDNSVQPYGVDIPKTFDRAKQHRVDFWFHGRSETLSEVNFINGFSKSPGGPKVADGIVLYPYGRYCNANKFAGEIDAFEALDDVKRHYPVDPDRIIVRGFSMGGAAAWHFAVHHASKWAAAQPGAGFAETPDFLRVFQDEVLTPNAWEAKLLHWYDCTDWAENVSNVPLVAYSGEKDKQKQAADIMAVAMEKEGLSLIHLVGPGMGHGFDPASKAEVDRRMDTFAANGRNPLPKKIRFTAYTLRYPQMHWIRVDGLDEHWTRARVEAEMDGNSIDITAENVNRLTLSFDHSPLAAGETFVVSIGGRPKGGPTAVTLKMRSLPSEGPNKPLITSYSKDADGRWSRDKSPNDTAVLRKRRDLMGPIDDAFLDRFLMVEPTGTPMNDAVGKWAAAEMKHAIDAWRIHFRGQPLIKKDVDVTDDDLKALHLVLWGDPSSNAVLKRIADKLPIRWTSEGVKVGDKLYKPGENVPVLIYPNPLDDRRYVVINSGFTYREYDYLNNARQIPKLPDWAIVDITQPPTSQRPGRIADAGFFDERWQLTK